MKIILQLFYILAAENRRHQKANIDKVFGADVDDFMFPVRTIYRLNATKWAAGVANDNHLMPVLGFTAPIKFIHYDAILRLWML